MKKVLFSVFAVAAVMTACSKSDVVDAPNIDTPITFEAYSGKVPVSKATSINDQASLSAEGGFVVYAYNTEANGNGSYTPLWNNLYFNETLTLSNGSWKFNEKDGKTNVHYWPADGNELAFVAYSNNAGQNVVYNAPTSKETAPTISITVPNAVADQKDIMVATYNQTKNATDEVTLTFNHVLSRVYFNVITDRAIEISSIAIKGDFSSRGTIELYTSNNQNPSVNPSSEAEDKITEYEFLAKNNEGNTIPLTIEPKFDEDGVAMPVVVDNTLDKTDDYYMMLIPGDPSSVVITYSFDGDETVYEATADLTADGLDFKKGTSYRFDLRLVSSPINFDVDLSAGWGTDTVWGDTEVKFVSKKKI